MKDNGKEFNLDEMREISSVLNVQPYTTAGMSPYQNGLCKHVHAATDMMLTKPKAENSEVELETLFHRPMWQETHCKCGMVLAATN